MSDCVQDAMTFLDDRFRKAESFNLDSLDDTRSAEEQAQAVSVYLKKFPLRIRSRIAIAFVHLGQCMPHAVALFRKREAYICTGHGQDPKPIENSSKCWLEDYFHDRSLPQRWRDFTLSYFITHLGFSCNVYPREIKQYIETSLRTFEPKHPYERAWKKWFKVKKEEEESYSHDWRIRLVPLPGITDGDTGTNSFCADWNVEISQSSVNCAEYWKSLIGKERMRHEQPDHSCVGW